MNRLEYDTRKACQLWNWHTNPRALRTDDEHSRHRKAARKIDTWMAKNTREGIHWKEYSDGARYTL